MATAMTPSPRFRMPAETFGRVAALDGDQRSQAVLPTGYLTSTDPVLPPRVPLDVDIPQRPGRERTCSRRSTPPTTPRPHRQPDQQQAEKECNRSNKISVNRMARYGEGVSEPAASPWSRTKVVEAHRHAADKQQTFSGAERMDGNARASSDSTRGPLHPAGSGRDPSTSGDSPDRRRDDRQPD